jgi:mRNA interferase MazF
VIARGDIRWFRFGAPDKRRPVLVLGRPDILPSLSQVPVIPLSTQARGLSWEVALTQADGIPSPRLGEPCRTCLALTRSSAGIRPRVRRGGLRATSHRSAAEHGHDAVPQGVRRSLRVHAHRDADLPVRRLRRRAWPGSFERRS